MIFDKKSNSIDPDLKVIDEIINVIKKGINEIKIENAPKELLNEYNEYLEKIAGLKEEYRKFSDKKTRNEIIQKYLENENFLKDVYFITKSKEFAKWKEELRKLLE